MTLGQLRTRTLRRLDEDPAAPVTYTAAEVDAALNEGQQLFVLLTLCLEKTVTFPPDGSGFHRMLQTYPDWLVPLRIARNGVKVKPARLAELDALDGRWSIAAGEPERYAMQGFDLLSLSSAGQAALTITYAHAPAVMALDADAPQIPGEFHALLIEYALYRVRVKLGAQEFAGGLRHLAVFLDGASKFGKFTRARAAGLQYDVLPFELRFPELSKLIGAGKK
jgi:hypothetical protein